MKKILPLSLLLFGIIRTSQSQILFACESPSKDTITYLFSTHHRLPEHSFRFDPLIDSLIKSSEIIFVEMNEKDTSNEHQVFYQKMRQVVSYPNNKRLDDYLSPPKIEIIRSFYRREFNISDSVFNKYTYAVPWFMDNALKGKSPNTISVDQTVLNIAFSSGKLIFQLDRYEPILKTYAWLKELQTPGSLLQMVKNYSGYRLIDSSLIDSYLKQDTSGINNIVTTYSKEFIHELIVKRNKLWEELLLAQSKKINFVSVGAAHVLFGEGLLDFYAKRNYSINVIPINIKKE